MRGTARVVIGPTNAQVDGGAGPSDSCPGHSEMLATTYKAYAADAAGGEVALKAVSVSRTPASAMQ
jgi:hypothetical protein